jgi:type 2 lantibiotic biosynthesis protein LanM
MIANMPTNDWRLGLTLAERLDAIDGPVRIAPRVSRRRRKHWRNERRSDIEFVRRLTSHITVEPSWWREFCDVYRAARAGNAAPISESGFLVALGPIIAQRMVTVHSYLSRSTSPLLTSDTESSEQLLSSLAQSLRAQLSIVVTKTLVLELGVASRTGLLKGDTSEARFSFFCECLQDSSFAASLLAQYPVLVRRCIGIATDWEQSVGTLLRRVVASTPDLMANFFDDKHPGPLVAVNSTGDVHGRGQAVHVLCFQSGAQLVYKPRPVAMERCYYELISWLNDRGLSPKLKVVRSLDEGSFGWMEFVPIVPCDTAEGVSRFFERMGAHLALTYVLEGTDLHSENVIANGEYPVPVDLETLFHAIHFPGDLDGATARANAELRRSVVRTLLLPDVKSFGDDQKDWVDLSALGHIGEQLTAWPVAHWANFETDLMHLVHKRAKIPRGLSLPQFSDHQVQPSGYTDAVVHGFEQTYELVRNLQNELLGPQGPLRQFAGKTVRQVLRDTLTYALMLFASYHPRFQRDAIACEAMLRNALRGSSDGQSSWLKAIEDAEIEDLLACDIPYFSSTVGSTNVLASGQRAITLTGGVNLGERIGCMSKRDLEQQVWLIRVAMKDLAEGLAPGTTEASRSVGTLSLEMMVAAAARIGDRICDLAIEDGDRCTWMVPEAVNMRRLVTTVAGFDLYNGLSGIALFLAHLGAITHEDRYRRTADAAMREALALCRKQKVGSAKFGAFQGIGGLCYALVHLSAITNKHDLADEASMLISKFARRAARSDDLDLMSGLAGFIVAGLVVARFNADLGFVEKLRPAVEKLYRLTAFGQRSLAILNQSEAGLGHGRTGAGFALLRWAEVTGELRFRAAGQDLLRKDFEIVESSRGAPVLDNNFRHSADPLGWCRGGLGVAMAALAANPPVTELFDLAWAKNIVEEITAQPVGALCLCHGALGRLEFLRKVNDLLSWDGQKTEVEAWRRTLLDRIVGGHWVADSAHSLECPSLMSGLAGTGYSLLREAFGNNIPSILTLEESPPKP